MKGRFPGCVLAVTLPVTAVDVNVHPAKTQVKFAREHDVFDAVYHTVLDALDQFRRPGRGSRRNRSRPWRRPPGRTVFQTMDAAPFRQGGGEACAGPAGPAGGAAGGVFPGGRRLGLGAAGARQRWRTAVRRTSFYQATRTVRRARAPWGGRRPRRPRPPADSGRPRPLRTGLRPGAAAASAAAERPALQTPRPAGTAPKRGCPPAALRAGHPAGAAEADGGPAGPDRSWRREAAPWRIAGEVLNTYIICEDGAGNVWLIDKHAAHERINFDRLKASREPPMRQTLLTPIAAELSREDGALLLENLPELERFGFACEDFGDGTVLVREVPADIDAGDTQSTLEEFAECLRTGRSPEERREALLHTMACKAAIKGGWKSAARRSCGCWWTKSRAERSNTAPTAARWR